MSAAATPREEKWSSGLLISLPQALLLALVIYVCFFGHLDALGLVGPDEPRYAEVAREMAQSGDWVTPRLWGRPWFEKPILYYWGAALAYRLFGVNEFAARLPSALAALLAVLALAWAAWRAWGNEARSVIPGALLIFATCAAGIGFARAAAPEMLFSATLAAAMAAAFSIVEAGASAARRRAVAPAGQRRTFHVAALLFGAFLGAATLAKGPAAIVLAGGSAALWALATRRWRDALRLAHPLAITAFFAAALPWYALCARRNPEFLRVFLLEHNFERYLTPLFRHEQPFWFYAPVLLVALLPWTALLVPVARHAIQLWREKRWAASPGWFFACWAIFPVLFFSFSKSKLPSYILPTIPPLALLMARSAANLREKSRALVDRTLAAVGVTLILLGIVAERWLPRIAPGLRPQLDQSALPELPSGFGAILTLVGIASLGGLAVVWLSFRRRGEATLVLASLVIALLLQAGTRQVLPQIGPSLSPRDAARAAQAQPGAAENAYAFRLHRAWQYGLNFYLRRELPEWTPETPRPAWLITNAAGAAELERRGLRVSLVDRTSPQALLVIVSDRPVAAADAEH